MPFSIQAISIVAGPLIVRAIVVAELLRAAALHVRARSATAAPMTPACWRHPAGTTVQGTVRRCPKWSHWSDRPPPITIISGLPSAGIGALLTLILFGMPLSVIAMIGIVMLVGIVKKNAIMMVDFAIERRDRKSTRLNSSHRT